MSYSQFERGIPVQAAVITENNVHELPELALNQIQEEDSLNMLDKANPFRFGIDYPASINTSSYGNWEYYTDGSRSWSYLFTGKNAKGFSFQLTNLSIPEGGYLQLYQKGDERNAITYTEKVNNAAKAIGTTVVEGDTVILSVYEPFGSVFSDFQIINITQCYRPLSYFETIKQLQGIDRGLNDSGDCNLDVDCPPGDTWQSEKRAVGMILTGGSALCSGAIVNNTWQDGTPYFLTAEHCVFSNPSFWVFRFGWKSSQPVCASTANSIDPGPPYTEVNGATLVSESDISDFALLLLNNIPSGNPYYLGWDYSDDVKNSVHGIHHPNGDVMKISYSDQTLQKDTYGPTDTKTWKVPYWTIGTTEVGSSGSPLFSYDHRVIGVLTGGGAACSGIVDNNQPDYYGRFGVAWDFESGDANQLQPHLDPRDIPIDKISGYNPNASSFENDLSIVAVLTDTLVCTEPYLNVSFVVENTGTNNVNQAITRIQVKGFDYVDLYNELALAPSQQDTLSLDFVSIDNAADTLWIDNIVVNWGLDANSLNSRRAIRLTRQTGTPFNINIDLDCNPSETSFEIQQSGNVVASGGPYTSSDTVANEKFCLNQGCYDFIMEDAGGDGLSDVSCGRTTGSYVVTSLWGDVISMLAPDGDFGTSEQQQFCVGVAGTNFYQLQELKVIPNPSSGVIRVEGVTGRLSVRDVNGRLIMDLDLGGSNLVDLSKLKRGVYFVVAEGFAPTRLILN